jgi:hypothetical protein
MYGVPNLSLFKSESQTSERLQSQECKPIDLKLKDIALNVFKLAIAAFVAAGISAIAAVFLPIGATIATVALTAIAVYVFAGYLLLNKKISSEEANKNLSMDTKKIEESPQDENLIEYQKKIPKGSVNDISGIIEQENIDKKSPDGQQKLIEMATKKAKNDPLFVLNNLYKYGIKVNSEEGKAFSLFLAKRVVEQYPNQLELIFNCIEKLNIEDKEFLKSLAERVISDHPVELVKYIDKFNIQGEKEFLNNLANILVEKDPQALMYFFENLHLDLDKRIKLLDRLSVVNPYLALLNFNKFAIGTTYPKHIKFDPDNPDSKRIFLNCIKNIAIMNGKPESKVFLLSLEDNDDFFKMPEGQGELIKIANYIIGSDYSPQSQLNFNKIIELIVDNEQKNSLENSRSKELENKTMKYFLD